MSAHDEAFTAFVAARRPHLVRVAYALCGDWHRADDLVQTTLLKLYAAWRRVESGSEEAYVRTILVRAHIDQTRRPWWKRERSVAETARELRISEGTVKSHSSRGLSALRTCLGSGDASRT